MTPHDDDRHQDYRLVSQLTWNTWRDHAILEYEIMKYDGDLGRPNLFWNATLIRRYLRLSSCLRTTVSQDHSGNVPGGRPAFRNGASVLLKPLGSSFA